MTMNPLIYLDSLLQDWASPKVRRVIHSLVLLLLGLFALWQTFDGNWEAVVGALAAAVYAESNRANTPPIEVETPNTEIDDYDGNDYPDYTEGETEDDVYPEDGPIGHDPVSGNQP